MSALLQDEQNSAVLEQNPDTPAQQLDIPDEQLSSSDVGLEKAAAAQAQQEAHSPDTPPF